MPYNYKRLPRSRKYADYSNEHLQTCLETIRSEHFRIPRSTIKNKLKNSFSSSPGHPKVFSQEEELAFAKNERLYNVFVTMFRAVTGLSFLKRHPQSSFRLTSNEIEVPTTNVKDLKGSNEDMKEPVVKDKFFVVHWNGLRFPGLVLSVAEEGATVECMAPTKKFWKWPQEKDMLFYKWCDILKVIQPLKLVKRGLFKVDFI
ncbi:hypothetical protein J6590_097623 [Homalodisca vitripennis]|nr:hypothetical protein J6590_097623 [Homalodisca vitripennis]